MRLSEQVTLGKRSGIGEDSIISGKVTIGDNVMIGPELMCYTTNHQIKRTDIPMIDQGFSEMHPIIIGDDVWIGSRVIILGGGGKSEMAQLLVPARLLPMISLRTQWLVEIQLK